MLIELLRAQGGAGAELARRWLAALLIVPHSERAGVVEAVEASLVEEFGSRSPDGAGPLLHVASEEVERDGYTEVLIRSYEAKPKPPRSTAASSATKKRGGPGRGA